MGLLVCLLSLAAIFFGEDGFFQGLSLACLVGLLLFLKWDFFLWASSLLVVCGCQFFCAVVFFKACHWPAWSACCFSWSGISSVELPICWLFLAAIFSGEGGFFQGLSLACLVGLLLFLKWDFFHGASSLLVVSSCHIFWRRWFFSGPVTGLLGRPAAFLEVGFFPLGF